MVGASRGQRLEVVVRECIRPFRVHENLVDPFQSRVEAFIAPGVEATVEVQLHP